MKPYDFSHLPDDPVELESFIERREQSVPNLKEGTEARIIWAVPESKNITPVSVVYLHGFTASQGEGHPLHLQVARRYGINMYLSRLAGHGIDDIDAFKGLTPGKLVRSAAEAIEIGRKLGQKLIIMGTSTGGSLALYLSSIASRDFIKGLILYAPLVDFHGVKSWLLTHGYTRSLLKLILGNGFRVRSQPQSTATRKIWYEHYRLEGVLALGQFIEEHMHEETFRNIQYPVFTGYYYKNRGDQDQIVSVRAIRDLYHWLSTPDDLKQFVNFPDAGTHVICNRLLSKAFPKVRDRTFEFSENILGLKPLENS